MVALAVMLSALGSEEMSTTQGVLANAALLLFSLLAGYAYGRHQFERRKPKQFGFPVVTKDDGDSANG